MLGAIAGDIIGSVYEWNSTKSKDFALFSAHSTFTDDTVLTIAVAECILQADDYVDAFHRYYARYPKAGFGGHFLEWARQKQRQPYGSYGNGSAMRVSPIAWAFDTLEDVLHEARSSAAVTHDHPEGIRGAQATAAAIFLARRGEDKPAIRKYIEHHFGYDLNRRLDDIRPGYTFDVSCQGSVPESIIAFLESTDFEDTLRNAISLGGDADTMACIAGAIAEAAYGIPPQIEQDVMLRLHDDLAKVVEAFCARYNTRTVSE